MGYTHYFRSNLSEQADWFPAEQLAWDIAYAEAEKIVSESSIRLEESDWTPTYDAILVSGGCETLVIPQLVDNLKDFDFCKTRRYAYLVDNLKDFDFCKTRRHGYDAVVTAVLAVMAETGVITVSSDGFRSDWRDGVALASQILGREIPNPIHDD